MSPVCHICGEAAVLFTKKHEYTFYRCPHCLLIFLHPLPSLASTRTFYSEEYFRGKKPGFGYANYETDKRPMRPAFLAYLAILKEHAPDFGTLLDVGTSTGYFLKLAKEAGWNALGLEISPYAARIGQEAGLNIQNGTLEEVELPVESLTAITGFDVFEHLLDPHAFLEKAKSLLTYGGLLCINTPTADSLWARFWGKKWQAILPPEHTMLYNSKNIVRILEAHGFEILHLGKIPKRFTLSYIARMIYLWRGWKLFLWLSATLSRSRLRNLSIPLNVRDNVFVLARKK